MMRSCSMPPSGFLALAGTMNGSPPDAQMVPNGILSAVDAGGRADRHAEVLRAWCFAASFSTQEPFGMKSALPLVQAVCDWMWSRPGRALEDVALLDELVVRLEARP